MKEKVRYVKPDGAGRDPRPESIARARLALTGTRSATRTPKTTMIRRAAFEMEDAYRWGGRDAMRALRELTTAAQATLATLGAEVRQYTDELDDAVRDALKFLGTHQKGSVR